MHSFMSHAALRLVFVSALALGYRAFARQKPHSFGLLAISMAEPRVLLREPGTATGVISAMVAALTPLSCALERAVSSGKLREGNAGDRSLCVFALLQASPSSTSRFATQPISSTWRD